jgi:hypothetical protein
MSCIVPSGLFLCPLYIADQCRRKTLAAMPLRKHVRSRVLDLLSSRDIWNIGGSQSRDKLSYSLPPGLVNFFFLFHVFCNLSSLFSPFHLHTTPCHLLSYQPPPQHPSLAPNSSRRGFSASPLPTTTDGIHGNGNHDDRYIFFSFFKKLSNI